MPLPEISTRIRPRTTGGAGTLISGGILSDNAEHNSDLEGDKWYGTPSRSGIADKMIRDAHCRMSMEYVSGPLRAASWEFEATGEKPIDKEAAEFCNWAFFRRLSFDKFLREALTYKVYGFSMFEVTDQVEEIPKRFKKHPGRGLGVVLTGLHHRPAWTTYRWLQSKRNPTQLRGWEQWILGGDGEKPGVRFVNAARLLRFTENQQGATFSGVPTLRSAYGPWKVKLTLQVVEAMSHERMHMGTPTIRLPEGAADEDIDTAAEILGAMRANEKGYLVLPHGFDFKWETVSKGDGTAISETIERANRDIAYNCRAGFMMLGLTGATGSYALATSQQGQFEIGLEADARFIADTINQGSDGWSPVERLVRMNYGEKVEIPRLVVRNMPTRDWSKVLPVVHNLSVSKLITPDDVTEQFIRDVLRLPARDPETERVSAAPAGKLMPEEEEEPEEPEESEEPENQVEPEPPEEEKEDVE